VVIGFSRGYVMKETIIVTFKAPRQLIEEVDKLVNMGLYNSRSEVFRHALALFLSNFKGRYNQWYRGDEGEFKRNI